MLIAKLKLPEQADVTHPTLVCMFANNRMQTVNTVQPEQYVIELGMKLIELGMKRIPLILRGTSFYL